jgi:hypothetical protein
MPPLPLPGQLELVLVPPLADLRVRLGTEEAGVAPVRSTLFRDLEWVLRAPAFRAWRTGEEEGVSWVKGPATLTDNNGNGEVDWHSRGLGRCRSRRRGGEVERVIQLEVKFEVEVAEEREAACEIDDE